MSTLGPKGRALVDAGRRAFRPTDADRTRLLAGLRSQLGDAALPPDMSTAATAAAAGKSIWPIISAVVVAIGLVSGALFLTWHRGPGQDDVQRSSVAPVVAAPQTIEPVATPPAEPTAISEVPTPAIDPPAPPPGSAHRPQDRLAAEVAILSRATRDLRTGHPEEALRALDEYRRRFPKGLLNEEQCAGRVQALCALGRFDEANAKIGELAPRSTLAAQAKKFCDARLTAP
jgi:hypothetical protein